MGRIPEKFPEYSIMFKTLSEKIKALNESKKGIQGKELKEVQLKIKNYESEVMKIKKMFPDNFFFEESS